MRSVVLSFLACALAAPEFASADPLTDTQDTMRKPLEGASKADHKPSFIVMPIPLSNPAIGNGLAVAAIALYAPGGSPRPWTSGAGALYTDTKSKAAAVFQKAYLGDDRFRVTAAGGVGVFNTEFYGIGQAAGERGRFVDLEQDTYGGIAEALMRVTPKVYVGLRYRGASVDTTVEDIVLPQFPDLQPPEIELNSAVSQLGLSAEYDSRDSEYGPRRGVYAQGQWLFAREAFGSDFDYDLLNAAVNGYHRLDRKSILAWRGSICHASNGAPFYDICNFGSNNDLRGYPGGQFRDQAMFAVQAEYRRHLFWKVGGVAFAGVGEVARNFGKMNTENLLPAAGLGVRFEASKKYRVNASIDAAVGDGVSAVYFYIGEAF